jgi:hypothetical protein
MLIARSPRFGVISVVTNCSARKLNRPAPARELYRGTAFARIVRVVDEVRRSGAPVSLYVLSARYGLVGEWQVVEPYDATLRGAPPAEIRRWSREAGVIDALERVAAVSTLVLVVSKPYYIATEEVACKHNAYVLSPFRACGRWIRTGNFDKHIALRRLLVTLAARSASPS